MTVVAVAVLFVTLWQLYRTVYEVERKNLTDLANSQVRLIQAVTRFDGMHSQDDHAGGSRGATIAQLIDAHARHHRFDDGRELEIVRREGNRIVLLLDRLDGAETFQTLSWDSEFAEPLRRALEGRSGIMEALDHHGELSLVAYLPVPELEIAIVAKIDVDRIRAPFLTAAVWAGAVSGPKARISKEPVSASP
jgi:hypothetical protein